MGGVSNRGPNSCRPSGRESAVATRLSVNISEDTARSLRELAERNETSITEVIRRAVGVYKYIEDEVTINHKVLKLVSDDEVTTLALVG